MSDTALEGVLRRDRYVIFAALLILTALAWIYLFRLAAHMAVPAADPAMSAMPGMDMAAMNPVLQPWAVTDFFFGFIMWTVMMAGMMIPSAAPMILLYARVGRQAGAQHKPFAATGWFAGGYLLAWAIFSLLAALLQAGLSHAALLTPMMTSASNLMGGSLLIVAGLYQWSGWKNVCLANCRAPLAFIQQHGGFQRRALPSLGLGLRHGIVCIGCCWALMLLLFAGGIMNIVWIAGLAILVLFEKLLTDGRNVSRVIGLTLIIAGLVLACEKLP